MKFTLFILFFFVSAFAQANQALFLDSLHEQLMSMLSTIGPILAAFTIGIGVMMTLMQQSLFPLIYGVVFASVINYMPRVMVEISGGQPNEAKIETMESISIRPDMSFEPDEPPLLSCPSSFLLEGDLCVKTAVNNQELITSQDTPSDIDKPKIFVHNGHEYTVASVKDGFVHAVSPYGEQVVFTLAELGW